MSFRIIDVSRVDAGTVKACVDVQFSAWHNAAKRGALGMLYGVDICNDLYRRFGVKALHPSVDDTAKPGRDAWKRIDLYFQDSQWVPKPLGDLIRIDFKARRRVA